MAYNYDDDAPTNQYPSQLIPDAGGYIPIAIADDGGALCEQCVRDQSNPVYRATPGDHDGADGWGIVGWMSSGDTDSYTACEHCNKVLVEDWEDA